MRFLVVFTIFLTVYPSLIYSKTDQEDLKKIRSIYRQSYDIIDNKESKEHFFVSFKNDTDFKTWKRVDTFDDVEMGSNTKIYFIKLHSNNNKILRIDSKLISRSRDWINTSYHYYYRNGKIAFVFEKHFTYLGLTDNYDEGPFLIEKRIYYDEQGKIFRKLAKAFVEENKKEVSPAKLQKIAREYILNINMPLSGFLKSIK